jgi:hypothetical protein
VADLGLRPAAGGRRGLRTRLKPADTGLEPVLA